MNNQSNDSYHSADNVLSALMVATLALGGGALVIAELLQPVVA